MPIRFRRTIKVAPGVKLNLSKSGISTTVGPKGFHFTFGKRGVRRTVSIPGTGISETEYIKKNETEAQKEKREEAEERREQRLEENREDQEERTSAGEHERRASRKREREAAAPSTGMRNGFVLLGVVVFFFIGAVALGLVPAHFLSNSLQYLAQVVQSSGH